MYFLMIWDKELASVGEDGCIDKFEIPLRVAKFFFQLDVERFPVLSSLRFDGYDMFSGLQVESLVSELSAAEQVNPLISEVVRSMLSFIHKAKSMNKCVLFDPFRAARGDRGLGKGGRESG